MNFRIPGVVVTRDVRWATWQQRRLLDKTQACKFDCLDMRSSKRHVNEVVKCVKPHGENFALLITLN